MTGAVQQKGMKTMMLGFIFALFLGMFSPFGFMTNTAFADETETTGGNNAIPTVEIGDNGVTMGGAGFGDGDGSESAWNQIITKYRGFIIGISGIAAITMVVIFIFQFMKLGAAAGNPQARSQALVGLLWSGVAAAGLGAVSLIVGLFYRSVG